MERVSTRHLIELQVIVFVAYLFFYALVMTFVEGPFNMTDSLWFVLVTVLSIGYGNTRPVSTVGRP